MNLPGHRLVLLVAAIAVAALIGIQRSCFGPDTRIRMALVEYRRWPHFAVVCLTNGSRSPVFYLARRDHTSEGAPLLELRRSPGGWTNASVPHRMLSGPPGRPVYVEGNPALPPVPGERMYTLLRRELQPGQAVRFVVPLNPGDPPRRVGTICCLPGISLREKLETTLGPVLRFLRIQTRPSPPPELKVWCPESLAIPAPP